MVMLRACATGLLVVAMIACNDGESSRAPGGGGAGGAAGEGGGSAAEAGLAGQAGQGAAGAGTGGAPACSPSATNVPCQQVTLPVTEVAEEIVVVETVPSGAGGPLVDGDYDIVAHVRYRTMPTSAEEPTLMRAALRIGGDGTTFDYAYVEDLSSLPDSEATGFSAAMCANETALVLRTTCPAEDEFSLTYTAQGDQFSIFEDNEELRFQRRP